MCGGPLAKSLLVSASAAAAATAANCCCCCCCSLYCCCDNADCVGNDDCVVTATCAVTVVADDGPTRLLLLAVAVSNDGVVNATCVAPSNDGPTRLPLLAVADSNDGVVVVMAMEWDDDCVTVDDRVTRPFTPDASDAFDELADWAGLPVTTHTQ